MVSRRQSHRFRQASFAGVIHAHQALQFGELADHGRPQVRLGQTGRLFGHIGISADQGGDFAGEGGDAGDAVGLGAEFVVEGHGFQAVQPFGHAVFGDAEVFFPEEFRVAQASRQHLLVALQNRGTMVHRVGVGDGHKAFYAARSRILDREKLLVFAHRGLQNLGRQVQELFGNPAHQRDGPFDQTGNFGQETGVGDQFQPGGEGQVLGALQDGGLAFGCVQNHEIPLQFQGVIVET